MLALREILFAHSPVLLLDTSSEVVHAGWCEAGASPTWTALVEEAGAGLFRALGLLGKDVNDAGAFVFCEGPGSNLGIRTAAVALRTWQVLRPRPMFAYRSLELLAAACGRHPLTLIVDARRQQWHALSTSADGSIGAISRVAPGELQAPLGMPAGFRHWTPLPSAAVETLPYDLPRLWQSAGHRPLLRAVVTPDAFPHEEPVYAAWTPRVHQAPSA